jgi:hypothetical protein
LKQRFSCLKSLVSISRRQGTPNLSGQGRGDLLDSPGGYRHGISRSECVQGESWSYSTFYRSLRQFSENAKLNLVNFASERGHDEIGQESLESVAKSQPVKMNSVQ